MAKETFLLMSFAALTRRNNYRLLDRPDYSSSNRNVMAEYAAETDRLYQANAAKIRDARLQVSGTVAIQEDIREKRAKEQDRIWKAQEKTTTTLQPAEPAGEPGSTDGVPQASNGTGETSTMTNEGGSSVDSPESNDVPYPGVSCPTTMEQGGSVPSVQGPS